MPLWKFLCENFDIKTQREAELYITNGRVKLNGLTISSIKDAEQELWSGTIVEVNFVKKVP